MWVRGGKGVLYMRKGDPGRGAALGWGSGQCQELQAGDDELRQLGFL